MRTPPFIANYLMYILFEHFDVSNSKFGRVDVIVYLVFIIGSFLQIIKAFISSELIKYHGPIIFIVSTQSYITQKQLV